MTMSVVTMDFRSVERANLNQTIRNLYIVAFLKNALQSAIFLCISASESQPLFSPHFIDFSKDRPEKIDIM